MEKREKMLALAVSVAIIGTASLYLLSESMENQGSTCTVKEVLKNPEKYINKDISVRGNMSDIKRYGNTTVFYMREGNYSLRCVSYGNITIEGGTATVSGRLTYNERWGSYELVVKKVEYER